MSYRVIHHTADSGIEAEAGSLAALVAELAAGMFSLIAELEPAAADHWVELRVESPTLEDLVVDTLSELLYRSEVEDLVFCSFEVEEKSGELALTVRAGGVQSSSVEQAGAAVKAVTYHRLSVERRDRGWWARVYFDV